MTTNTLRPRIALLMGVLVMAVAMFSGCGPKSSIGFTLPDGDVEQGRETFQRLQCNACHAIEGVEALANENDKELVRLGGNVVRVATYGQLVTSIINPSHRFAVGYAPESVQTAEGESRMKNYNQVMTVQELIDLVAFLQSKYTIAPVDPTPYPNYPMY